MTMCMLSTLGHLNGLVFEGGSLLVDFSSVHFPSQREYVTSLKNDCEYMLGSLLSVGRVCVAMCALSTSDQMLLSGS